ncbi:MAG: helix-turn-helix domain-containing protein [Ignisphaera sp.]
MSQDTDLMQKFLKFMDYVHPLGKNEEHIYTVNELAEMWGIDREKVKTILRKLRREGFIRRTKGGGYKLTLAARILIRIYKRVKK